MKLFLFTFVAGCAAYNSKHIRRSVISNRHLHAMKMQDTPTETPTRDVWTVRRKIIRSTFYPVMHDKLRSPQKSTTDPEDKSGGLKNAVVFSAVFMAISAAALRVGGRAALVNILGLDFVANSDIKQQVDDFVVYFQSLGDIRYAAWIGAWIVSKNLFIDPLTILLAISSGVLFGGVWQGTAASVVSSSIASLVGFYLARTVYREKALEMMSKRPTLRAIDRACATNGFKTCFTLRVSPVFPIPIGAYNYIYGTTSVPVWEFLLGVSLGSIKPYLLDSYLGIFGKSILDNDDSQNDWILVAVFGLVILVGTLAADVASKMWEEIQAESNSDTEGGNTKSSSMQEAWGIRDEDIPSFLLGFKEDLSAAWSRVSSVVQDEWAAINAEEQLGFDVSDTVDWNGRVSANKVKWIRDTAAPLADAYEYPGVRNISAFETAKPSVENLKEYTYESIVFSFALMFFFSKYALNPAPTKEATPSL